MTRTPGVPRAMGIVVVATALSLATGLALLAVGPDVFEPDSVGADAFSKSAVGHRAFVEVLEGLGLPVVVSRFRTSDRGGPGTLLLVLEPQKGNPILDETVHGHGRRPSLWAMLFRWPLVLPVMSALVACLLWVAAGAARFGSPHPAGPGVSPGSRFLIENSADLLRLGGHAAHALDRYLATTVQEVARATHAPAHLSARDLRSWIASAGEGRRVATRLEDLEEMASTAGRSADRHEVLEAAVRIHGWREAMTHGPRGDS